MHQNEISSELSKISDEAILEEVANRLQIQFKKENGSQMLYGTFRFVFHEGQFQCVEDWPRNKRYESPSQKNIRKIKPLERG